MTAYNIPNTCEPVVTFWEGEVISKRTAFSFLTGKWKATQAVDQEHWQKFDGFRNLSTDGTAGDLVDNDALDLGDHDYIFMRWKERKFTSAPKDCRLTIAGFYYICMERSTGKIEGVYYGMLTGCAGGVSFLVRIAAGAVRLLPSLRSSGASLISS